VNSHVELISLTPILTESVDPLTEKRKYWEELFISPLKFEALILAM
jgi:hypothetical protein